MTRDLYQLEEKKIRVHFNGEVTIKVPKDAPKNEILANNYVFSKIAAVEETNSTTEDSAFFEYCDEIGLNEYECELKYGKVWQAAKITNISGSWYEKEL